MFIKIDLIIVTGIFGSKVIVSHKINYRISVVRFMHIACTSLDSCVLKCSRGYPPSDSIPCLKYEMGNIVLGEFERSSDS
jgi:hypothetical protein